jgi:SAM-dependent methyltransferase
VTESPLSDQQHQEQYTQAIDQAFGEGADAFQNWFNQAGSVQQAILRGFWDFRCHILTDKVAEAISNPEDRTALEIGYGGGRLINAACTYFGQAIGVDIHDKAAEVAQFLHRQGRSNFRLLRTSGRTIELDAASVDFVYSFIVLQHLPTFDVLMSYLRETYRCLKPGGLAQLYFGAFTKLTPADRLRYWRQGYKEITDAPVNHTSLVVRVGTMSSICSSHGFRVIDSGVSYKTVPNGYRSLRGGQNFVTVRK